MGFLGKYGNTIDIVAKISIIIMLLFICYKNLTYEEKINRVYEQVSGGQYSLYLSSLPEIKDDSADNPAGEEEIPVYRVYISGAVNNSGVYNIEPEKRIIDLIELAGGVTEDADLEIINIAAFVEDARHVRIPFLSGSTEPEAIPVFADVESPPGEGLAAQYNKPAYTGPVNINTANETELMSLPGVGQVTAGNIIAYREQNGGFKSIEEIKNVNRIGDSLFNSIKDMITY